MKKEILSVIFFWSFVLMYSQEYEYIPLVNEDCVWSYCDIVKTESEEYDLHYLQFQFGGDTIINSSAYKKLYEKNCSSTMLFYAASLREENKKVFACYKDETQEKLIYDFDLFVGDSMLSPYDNTNFYKVIKIDSVDIGGGRRKRIELDFDTWIEGIGTLNRFMIYPLQALPLYDLGIRINYQKQGAEIIYQTNEWYYNSIDCSTSLVKQTEQSQQGIYFVAPGLLVIAPGLSDQSCLFELFDLNGSLLIKRNINISSNTINVNHISNGLYFFRLSGSNKVKLTGKVMKN